MYGERGVNIKAGKIIKVNREPAFFAGHRYVAKQDTRGHNI